MGKKLKVPAMVFALALIPVAFTGGESDATLGVSLKVNDGCARGGDCCFVPGSLCEGIGNRALMNHEYCNLM